MKAPHTTAALLFALSGAAALHACGSGKPARRDGRPAVEACPAAMVHIPGGTFVMGSREDEGRPDEHPAHQVTVAPFCLARLETTVAEYARCVDAKVCPPPASDIIGADQTEREQALWSLHCQARHQGVDDHPVNCIDWFAARAYCAWRGGRLPTEPEWEFAARGTDGRRYPWGNEDPTLRHTNACDAACDATLRSQVASPDVVPLGAAWPTEDGWPRTAPVGSVPLDISPFGIRDMAGNMREWTSDVYAPYGAAPVGPVAPDAPRVFRGGSWQQFKFERFRTTRRYAHPPSERRSGLGVRCASDVVQR